jgi:radical SAM superfamily enzyme YgiQ (UPF0313 family)
MAPALLKAVLQEQDITAVAIDLNIEIINQIQTHPHKQKILDFFFSQVVHNEVIDDLDQIISYCSARILDQKPTLIALSLFCYSCQIFTRWLCADLKSKCPNIKILIGGTGIKNFVADTNDNFYRQVIQLGLVDDFIFGDAEVSIIEYIKGNLEYSGINSTVWIPIIDLNSTPYPDYSDYNFNAYPDPVIPINDSRGCIKNCEFCDIIEHWKKFQSRTADSVFNEMLHQISKHNLRRFALRNSLTNGNMKEFKKLLTLICAYNNKKPRDLQISWEGYFIIRSSEYHPPELWEQIKYSNGKIFLGVESVIFKVRHAMGKTFSDVDLDYHLQMSKQYLVPMALLMIVAYPTETLEDYEYTKQWFRDRKEFAKYISFVNLSFASILPGTQLSRRSDEYGIKKGKLPSIWINQNLNISSKDRLNYLLELNKVCREECGFVTLTSEETIEHTNDDYLY